MKKFDFIIIGAGAGGVTAALTAAERRQSVAILESQKAGGTCVHSGCLPIKSLVISSRFLKRVKHGLDYGVATAPVEGRFVDFLTRQRQVVSKTYQQILQNLAANDVKLLQGSGKLLNDRQVIYHNGQNEELIEARRIIIATGSSPAPHERIIRDGRQIIDSNDMIALTEVPSSLVCIGGGYISCTYAQIMNQFGCRVTIVERGSQLLPEFGSSASSYIHRVLEREGIEIRLLSEAIGHETSGDEVLIELSGGNRIPCQKALVSMGRKPNTDLLGLENLGIRAQPFISVNSKLETSMPGVYAIGDVNGQSFFAHAAIAQARIAVMNALGEPIHFRKEFVPVSINTSPEVACVGMSEHEAKESGYDLVSAQRPLSEVARALALGDLEGFIKILADRKSRKILGAVVVGENAEELIGLVNFFVTHSLTLEQACQGMAPHPSYMEAVYDVLWMIRAKC